MKKILKKAELVNTIADSVIIVMLIEKDKAYIIEVHAFNCQGKQIHESTKIYTTYRTAAEKYSTLISMLS